MLIRDARLQRTCTVTRPPAAGQSGLTTVATGLACSQPWPASEAARAIPGLGTVTELYELAAAEADFNNDDTLTMDDGTIYKIKMAQRWQASRSWKPVQYYLFVEKANG